MCTRPPELALSLDLGLERDNPTMLPSHESNETIVADGIASECLSTATPRTPASALRRSSFIKSGDRKMSQVAAFSPALAHWELAQHNPEDLAEPGAFDFESALLFVDIRCAQCPPLDCTLPMLFRTAPRSGARPGACPSPARFMAASCVRYSPLVPAVRRLSRWLPCCAACGARSGFTTLCTKLDIDVLQRHINSYFGELMDVVTRHGGDVLRFAGDALYCSWSLPVGAGAEGTLAIATLAACRCAIELNMRCSSYHIPEIDERLSM